MSKNFFAGTRPGKTVTYGKAAFELPIHYYRDDFFVLLFTADYAKVKALMPTPNLYPARMWGDRAVVGFGAYNYINTSIGPYGEIGVVVPAVYGKDPLPLIPALLETRYPNFGMVVLHLPVTRVEARDAGRGEWGYTKFLADMHFINTPEFLEVRMDEEAKHILTMRVMKKGLLGRDCKPLVTFSVKDQKLIKTDMPQAGTARKTFFTKGSFLKLGDHPVAEGLKQLDLSPDPVQSRYYVDRSLILPSGRVIEENVKPLEGYYGKDREAKHAISYLAGE